MENLKSQFKLYATLFAQNYRSVVIFSERMFLSATQNINFGLFCAIYAFLLIFVLLKVSQPSRWRPQNRELISRRQYYKEKINAWVMGLPFIRSSVQKKIAVQMAEIDRKVVTEVQKLRDPRKASKLPSIGMSEQNLRRRITEWHSKQLKNINTGKVSGTIYALDQEFHSQMNDFAAKYMYQNPLHFDSFKELLRIESEVLKITSSLISNNPEKNAFGYCTGGGSESLIMALYAYRESARKERPNIVVPNTVHAAVDKGCFYFNIEVRKAQLNSEYEVDVKHLESMIDSNTILIIGSYPNYPHGIADPIDKLAKIGLKHKVGVHIDACLGGFIAGFDKELQENMSIDRDGITSISLDQHKFGLAPKGISSIFFKTKQLRHCMYYIDTEWCGGIYCTPSFTGSRTGFGSAGAWYALTHVTRKVYKLNSKQIIEATKETAERLRKVSGIKMFGSPKICALAFTSTEVCPFEINSYLTAQKGYHLSSLHKPNGIHVSMTLANCEHIIEHLAEDVAEALEYVKSNPSKKSEAAIYGATADLSTNQIGDQLMKTIIGALLK